MAFKNYNTALADGDIYLWFPDSVATADRLNQNIKYIVDDMVQLQAELQTSINGSTTSIDLNLEKINQLISDVNSNMGLINTKQDSSAYDQRVIAVDSALASINTLIQNLDDTYATDTDIAGKVTAINDAWLQADSNLQATINILINDRYTKSATDTLLATKADKSDTYAKAYVDSNLGLKFDKTGGTITGSIIPDVSNTYDIGSSVKPFRKIYVQDVSMKIGASIILA